MVLQVIPNNVKDPTTMLDVGEYLFGIEEIKEEYTEEGSRLFYIGKYRVIQPTSHAGQLQYERFYIGTDEDPPGNQVATWEDKAGRLKKCSEAAGVPFTGQNPQVVFQQMLGKQLCGKVIHKPYKDKKTGDARIGANVQMWGTAGSMTPQVQAVDGNSGQPVGAPVGAPAQVAAPAPVTVPVPGQGSGTPPVQPPAAGGVPPLPPGAPQY